MSDFNLILLEPLLIVAGLVVFAVWQFRDLNRAREQTRRAREAQASQAHAPKMAGDEGDRG